MNISKQYAWRTAENYRENNPPLPQNLRGMVIGMSGCGKTLLKLWKNFISPRHEEPHTSMLTIVIMIYPSWSSNSFVMGYGVRSTTL